MTSPTNFWRSLSAESIAPGNGVLVLDVACFEPESVFEVDICCVVREENFEVIRFKPTSSPAELGFFPEEGPEGC